jgi:ABC-2 type transport system permease protein
MILRALVRKEFIELGRDPVTLAVAVLLPLVLLFLFGYGIRYDVENVALAVRDQDRTPESARLVERFTQSGYFRQVAVLDSPRAIGEALDRGHAAIVLDIPAGFASDLAQGREARVQVLLDGSFSPSALIVSSYAAAIGSAYSADLSAAAIRRLGLPVPAGIRMEARVWYNPTMRSVNYIVPGLFAVLLMAFPPMLTALAIVREKERGTIAQIYVSPVRPAIFVFGKIVPYALLAYAEMLLVLAVGTWWFGIPFRGHVSWLLAASLLYVFVTVGMGVLVSTITRTQVSAVLLTLVFTLMPSVLFSGFIFPVATMPYVLQLYTYVFPARYFMDLSRDLFLKGVGIEFLWANLALLALYALVVVGLASLRLRKKVA